MEGRGCRTGGAEGREAEWEGFNLFPGQNFLWAEGQLDLHVLFTGWKSLRLDPQPLLVERYSAETMQNGVTPFCMVFVCL